LLQDHTLLTRSGIKALGTLKLKKPYRHSGISDSLERTFGLSEITFKCSRADKPDAKMSESHGSSLPDDKDTLEQTASKSGKLVSSVKCGSRSQFGCISHIQTGLVLHGLANNSLHSRVFSSSMKFVKIR